MNEHQEAHFNQRLHERVLFLLYQKQFRDGSFQFLNQSMNEDPILSDGLEFGEAPALLAEKIFQHKKEIYLILEKHLRNWKITRIMLVDKIVLQIGVYELVYESDMKTSIIIDRAIRLSKLFGGELSGQFVNGILGSVYREYRKHEVPGQVENKDKT